MIHNSPQEKKILLHMFSVCTKMLNWLKAKGSRKMADGVFNTAAMCSMRCRCHFPLIRQVQLNLWNYCSFLWGTMYVSLRQIKAVKYVYNTNIICLLWQTMQSSLAGHCNILPLCEDQERSVVEVSVFQRYSSFQDRWVITSYSKKVS